MKEKLTLLFLCLLILGMAQDGCQESRLDKIQTGEIILNPNDLGTAGANKNYLEPLSRANFGATDLLSYAVAIAGFETSCSQTYFSLIVDIVEPVNENTKLKLVIDFRNKAQNALTSWTKVKLSYLVTSTSRYPPTKNGISYIWATSQYVNVNGVDSNGLAVISDPVLLGADAATIGSFGTGCGLEYDSTNKVWRFGMECDSNPDSGNSVVDKDVAIHTYIMGFHYESLASTNKNLAVSAKYTDWTDDAERLELVFFNDGVAGESRTALNTVYQNGGTKNAYGVRFNYATDVGGPIYDISGQNGELKGIKIAIVMSIVNPVVGVNPPDNGFGV